MPVESKAVEGVIHDPRRELSGEKVQRIVDAMRHCVAERGIAGATFEQVSREAGVSRGNTGAALPVRAGFSLPEYRERRDAVRVQTTRYDFPIQQVAVEIVFLDGVGEEQRHAKEECEAEDQPERRGLSRLSLPGRLTPRGKLF